MSRSGTVRMWSLALGVLVVLLSLSSRTQAAEAERQLADGEPATSRVLQIGVGGEYGVKLAGPELNPWGFGLGVHLGYTLPMGVYFGVPFDYFFGTEDTYGGAAVEAKLWQVGIEGGYDLALGRTLVLRFKGSLGVASVTTAGCIGDLEAPLCARRTESKPVFGPGLTFLYLGPSFSFTLDGRYELLPTDPLAHGLIFSIGFGF
jgi:hypothetical protein